MQSMQQSGRRRSHRRRFALGIRTTPLVEDGTHGGNPIAQGQNQKQQSRHAALPDAKMGAGGNGEEEIGHVELGQIANEHKGQEEGKAVEDVHRGTLRSGLHGGYPREGSQRVQSIDLVAILQVLEGGNIKTEEEQGRARQTQGCTRGPDQQAA